MRAEYNPTQQQEKSGPLPSPLKMAFGAILSLSRIHKELGLTTVTATKRKASQVIGEKYAWH